MLDKADLGVEDKAIRPAPGPGVFYYHTCKACRAEFRSKDMAPEKCPLCAKPVEVAKGE